MVKTLNICSKKFRSNRKINVLSLCVSKPGPWHFDNVASLMIDDVFAEDAGLLYVLPLAVHLKFFLTDK